MVSDILEKAYRILEIVGMLVSLACCISVTGGKTSKNQQNLLLTCIFGLIATVGNLMEVYSTTPEAALVAIKLAYMGKCYILIFGLLFVSGYSSVKLNPWLIRFLWLANTVVLATVVTCEHHHLYYSTINYEIRRNGRAAMLLTPGPFYYVWIGLLLLGAGTYVVIARRELRRGSRIAKLRMRLVFMAVALPMVASISFMVMKLTYFDPATFVIMMSELCLLFAMKRYGLLDTLELARERIIEDTRDGVLVIDNTKSEILHQNQAAEDLISRVTAVKGSFDLEQFTKEQESLYELDGRHYEVRISEIVQNKSSEVQGYVVWIFDMTFIDEYTNEMIRLKEEAEKANLAKTDFLANISHEIRTPMNSIVGYTELALKNKDIDFIHNYLKKIKKSSDVLLHLIDELLDITKIESGRMKIVKVNYSLEQLVHEVRHTMEVFAGQAGLALIVRLDSELPVHLYGDRMKVQDIIANLISNGIKYTHQGCVVLSLRLKEITDKRVLISIQVDDTGIGISDEEREKIFSKFERGDWRKRFQTQGSGLGLSIVKNFVDMMDGRISYESEEGQGTRFIADIWQELGSVEEEHEALAAEAFAEEKIVDGDFYEPENADAATESGVQAADAEPEASEDASEVSINSGDVLIVDDNDLNLEVASGIMELLGMNTQTADSGIECLRLLDEGAKPDVIFVDYMMPELDGLETMKKIRERGGMAETPVVLLTANAVSGVRDKMLEEGFDDFLSKPIDIDELQRILIRFLGRKN